MASSKIQICNMALAHLGISTFIADLTERSKEAAICSLFFDATRDEVLEVFEWGFANRRVALALSNAEFTNWLYAYAYPSDCIAARRIVLAGQRTPRADQRIPFEIGNNGTARLILTDQEDAELVYTTRIIDPNLFSSSFVAALSYALAAKIAMPLSVSATIAQNAAKQAQSSIDNAVANNLREAQDDAPPESEFISARA